MNIWCKLILTGGLLIASQATLACSPANDDEFQDCRQEMQDKVNKSAFDVIVMFEHWKNDISGLNAPNKLFYYTRLSTAYSESGKYGEGKKIAEEGLRLSNKYGIENADVVYLMYNKGFYFEINGEIGVAKKWYAKGLLLAQRLGDIHTIIEGHLNLGAYYYQTNQLEKSLAEITKAKKYAVSLSNDQNDLKIKGEVAGELGHLYSRMDKINESIKYQLEAIDYFKRIGKLEFVLIGYSNIAGAYVYVKDYDSAEKIYDLLLKESGAIKYARHHFSGLTGMAGLKIEKEAWVDAYDLLVSAETIIDAEEQIDLKIGFYIDKAKVVMELSDYKLSAETLKLAEDLLFKVDDYTGRSLSLRIMKIKTELFKRTGRLNDAYDLQSKYIEDFIKLREINGDKVAQEMRIKYETEQAEAKNILLMQRNKMIEIERSDQEIKMVGLSVILLVFSAMLGYQFVLKRRLVIAATTDPLTQVMNRRCLSQKGVGAFDSARSKNGALSVIMFDVDYFKHINDRYGHNIGDEVLKSVSKISKSAMRDGDFFGRWGGEEFVAVLPGASDKDAKKVAERVAKAFEGHDWSSEGLDYNVTVSIGVLSCKKMPEAAGFPSLVDQADAAMYRAKNDGRNRIVTAQWIEGPVHS